MLSEQVRSISLFALFFFYLYKDATGPFMIIAGGGGKSSTAYNQTH